MSKNLVVPRVAVAILMGFCAWLIQKPQKGPNDPGAEAALAFVEASILNGSTLDTPSVRGPASIDMHRHAKDANHTFKLSSGVEVKVVAPQDFEVNKPMHLIGTVKSNIDMPMGSIEWQVPAGISIVEGDVKSSIENIKADQAYTFHLVIKQSDNMNRQVHLAFTAKQGDMQFSELAQHNTVDQKTLDMAVQRLKQRHLKYLEDNAPEAGRKPTQE